MKNILLDVYKCDDFQLDKKHTLRIWNPTLVGMVKCHNGFNELCDNFKYDAMCCPGLMECDLVIIMDLDIQD